MREHIGWIEHDHLGRAACEALSIWHYCMLAHYRAGPNMEAEAAEHDVDQAEQGLAAVAAAIARFKEECATAPKKGRGRSAKAMATS
jgi:hypothetical protein